MAPVVNIPVSRDNKGQPDKHKKPIERRPELFCRVKYCNTLPDIPFDPKFIVYPFDTNRFVQYKQTSLEKNFKHDLLTEHNLGVTVDLINPSVYDIPDYNSIRQDEDDEKLLEDEIAAPQDTKRSRCHNRTVTWLKKTEYISTEFNRYGASSEKTETKVGFGVKKKMEKDENNYVDKDRQILAINKTFEAAKKPITAHPGKPGVKPVEVLPVFPDFDLWKYPFAQVTFDADPAKREEEMRESILRGTVDGNKSYVMYFTPTENTLNKRKIDKMEGRDYIYDEEYEYTNVHEFDWNVKNKNTQKNFIENYFFVWRENEVVYNELETRVRLNKRRVRQFAPNTNILAIKHRDLNDVEIAIEQNRLLRIAPHSDLPEEEEVVRTPNYSAEDNHNFSNKEDNENSNNRKNDGDGGDKTSNSEDSDDSDSDSDRDKRRNADSKRPTKRQKVSDSDKSSSSSSSSSESEDSEDEKKSSSSSASSDDSDDEQNRLLRIAPHSDLPEEEEVARTPNYSAEDNHNSSDKEDNENSNNRENDGEGGDKASNSDDSDSDSDRDKRRNADSKRPTKRQKDGDQSDSDKSSSSSFLRPESEDSEDEKKSSSSSASSDDSDDEYQKRRKQEAADIFGSDSD